MRKHQRVKESLSTCGVGLALSSGPGVWFSTSALVPAERLDSTNCLREATRSELLGCKHTLVGSNKI